MGVPGPSENANTAWPPGASTRASSSKKGIMFACATRSNEASGNGSADARPGDIILYEDAYRNISIAINGGNAAEMFGIREGQDIRIHLDAF
jgi:S-adenosylmethionine hydrolase